MSDTARQILQTPLAPLSTSVERTMTVNDTRQANYGSQEMQTPQNNHLVAFYSSLVPCRKD
eukprot:scaffold338895_cov21-Prasinocladus_malaysianus.AAC.1